MNDGITTDTAPPADQEAQNGPPSPQGGATQAPDGSAQTPSGTTEARDGTTPAGDGSTPPAKRHREDPPRFRGVTTYRDPLGRFSFRHPSTWYRFDLDQDREGVLFSPEEKDPQSYFAAWVSKLDEHVVAEDLDTLREGIEEGLSRLANCQVEARADETLSNLIKFERIYTFDDGGTVRKRRVWILYVDTWQIVLVFQGETPEEYRYWLSMGNYCFATFELPQELWFATDRDLHPYATNPTK